MKESEYVLLGLRIPAVFIIGHPSMILSFNPAFAASFAGGCSAIRGQQLHLFLKLLQPHLLDAFFQSLIATRKSFGFFVDENIKTAIQERQYQLLVTPFSACFRKDLSMEAISTLLLLFFEISPPLPRGADPTCHMLPIPATTVTYA